MDLIFPLKFVFITTGYSSAHPAIDIGWCDEYGGPHSPIYAPADGVVSCIQDGYGTDSSKGYGNYIQIDHGGGLSTIMAHCNRGGFTVRQGDRVARGQPVAHMGNSGNTAGYHTHTCVLVNGTRVNPLLYYHLDTKWQVVYSASAKEYKILTLAENPAKDYLTSADRSKNQLHVMCDDLRARKSPSLAGEVYGSMPAGYYNVKSIVEADGYRWVVIGDNLAAAIVEDCSRYIPFTESREKQLEAAIAQIAAIAGKVV